MRTNLSLRLFLAFLIVGVLSLRISAQDDMKPPPPIENAAMKMLMGTWKAEPYEMMGSKWSEVAVHSMKHNGQYMFIDITGTDDKNNTYTATVVMTSDKDGNLTGWSFDDWGMVSTYTGKSNGNKVTVTGKSSFGTETREIEINGNTMVHKVTWTMKGKDGKDMTQNMTITYNKQ
jgi:uncharacterized protein YneF (UPF0154 family)